MSLPSKQVSSCSQTSSVRRHPAKNKIIRKLELLTFGDDNVGLAKILLKY